MWKEEEPEILTERLRLRPFSEQDLDALPQIDADPEVTYFRGISPMSREDSMRWFRERSQLKDGEDRRWLFWCVRLGSDDRFLGMTLLRCLNPEWREYEVGYALGKRHWGQGFAGEAVRATLEFAVSRLEAHRIVANCYPQNQPSRRLLGKLGFRLEAEEVESYFEHGSWQNNVRYALLDREWSNPQPNL